LYPKAINRSNYYKSVLRITLFYVISGVRYRLSSYIYIYIYIIEKNEATGACSAYGGEACTGFWWGNLKERDHWGDPAIDGRIILRWIFRK